MALRLIDGHDDGGKATKGGCAASACGSRQDELAHLPEAIRAKVHNHPCFSEEAHHHYARMHVAVAPACNIQCHYCNRKYDCANESRPGVVSEVLTPEQAVKKVLAVAAHIPQMSVLGIAGPGDPLANPERTLATFRALSEKAPDIKLCLSTNGLALPGLVDEICAHNIDHVTITINCLDPDIGAEIYPWIFWNHRRIKGRRAAEILIEQQQKGLEALVARGVLVKVNSVMIPGVNDAHLAEVSRVVKAKGAFLHNVMPLIAKPEHGTFYGLMGQRGPTPQELRDLQDACAGDMRMMRHCRQCRADAVGMLGEDRSADFTLEKIATMEIDHVAAMKRRQAVQAAIEARRQAAQGQSQYGSASHPAGVSVALTLPTRPAEAPSPAATEPVLMAVATRGDGLVNQHFGQAREFLIYAVDTDGARLAGRQAVDRYCTGPSNCGDAEAALAGALQALAGCAAVLCAKIGFEPWGRLEAAGIEPNGEHADEPIETALTAVYREMATAGRLPQPSTTLRRQAC
ncbi:nitrogenase cofactor biosynthesis protein NifB [Thioflavicoccus mobilis 8321]|uniref:FeMo cofactor biosynthesis protein NifB n=1 Tax=Thioflavicoccus mobilis 8321 TaxID=765912 RepID=L0H139_9GAMM|nr:nitrogenase cofactor biosynthesis protein NifB [Thioflavicoccus mobilis]AGA91926.1 nitrogenase cofactor biosynthesis protein NifB [Thioflavicoccus mobilis 8321]